MRFVLCFLAMLVCCSSGTTFADLVILDNSGTGANLDEIDTSDLGTSAATVPVLEVPGLNLTVTALSTNDPGTFSINTTGTGLGIDSGASEPNGDDTDAFDSEFADSVTFQFDQDVLIDTLDFTTFTAGEIFQFAGVTIQNGDLDNGTTDVFIFDTPLLITANTDFTLTATTGTIGIEAIGLTVVPEPGSAFAIGLLGIGLFVRRRS